MQIGDSNKTVLLKVALRKESVDRNIDLTGMRFGRLVSLSARRAWIEIAQQHYLRKPAARSLSARRAWIEILVIDFPLDKFAGRSPQGERG